MTHIHTKTRGPDAVTTIELLQVFVVIARRAADGADLLFEVDRLHTLSDVRRRHTHYRYRYRYRSTAAIIAIR